MLSAPPEGTVASWSWWCEGEASHTRGQSTCAARDASLTCLTIWAVQYR